ncbi:hypothetical protein K1X76_12830 [bacterium]|nr:hypothetical protein [bacterium]
MGVNITVQQELAGAGNAVKSFNGVMNESTFNTMFEGVAHIADNGEGLSATVEAGDVIVFEDGNSGYTITEEDVKSSETFQNMIEKELTAERGFKGSLRLFNDYAVFTYGTRSSQIPGAVDSTDRVYNLDGQQNDIDLLQDPGALPDLVRYETDFLLMSDNLTEKEKISFQSKSDEIVQKIEAITQVLSGVMVGVTHTPILSDDSYGQDYMRQSFKSIEKMLQDLKGLYQEFCDAIPEAAKGPQVITMELPVIPSIKL